MERQTKCIMGDSKIGNGPKEIPSFLSYLKIIGIKQTRELPLCRHVLYRLGTHGFFFNCSRGQVRENPSTPLKRAPYCAFHKHANSKVQKSLSQLRFSLPSIIINITSNEP